MKLLRLKEVQQKTGLKRSTIYQMIQKGEFPSPVKPLVSVSLWPEHEVNMIIQAWISGATSQELRILVERIHRERESLRETSELLRYSDFASSLSLSR
jgi:prophage regulatory protein